LAYTCKVTQRNKPKKYLSDAFQQSKLTQLLPLHHLSTQTLHFALNASTTSPVQASILSHSLKSPYLAPKQAKHRLSTHGTDSLLVTPLNRTCSCNFSPYFSSRSFLIVPSSLSSAFVCSSFGSPDGAPTLNAQMPLGEERVVVLEEEKEMVFEARNWAMSDSQALLWMADPRRMAS